MKIDNSSAIQKIRSLGVAYVNRIVPAARHMSQLWQAFAEWNDGQVYVCKKTGDYRYRYGRDSKRLAPWSQAAREVFTSTSAFALAAIIFKDQFPDEDDKPANVITINAAMPKAAKAKAMFEKGASRADVIKIAIAGGAQ